MNDADDLLEAELRRLQPAAPRAQLAAAIARDLRDAPAPAAAAWPRRARLALWTSWTLTAAAAALAVIAWWPAARPAGAAEATAAPPTATSGRDGVVPVAASNVLFDARDEGIVWLEDGRPARKLRLHYVDTVRLRDDAANASIAVSRPREEVRLMPVSFY